MCVLSDSWKCNLSVYEYINDNFSVELLGIKNGLTNFSKQKNFGLTFYSKESTKITEMTQNNIPPPYNRVTIKLFGKKSKKSKKYQKMKAGTYAGRER